MHSHFHDQPNHSVEVVLCCIVVGVVTTLSRFNEFHQTSYISKALWKRVKHVICILYHNFRFKGLWLLCLCCGWPSGHQDCSQGSEQHPLPPPGHCAPGDGGGRGGGEERDLQAEETHGAGEQVSRVPCKEG